ncbi:hypothetical protein [Acidovorax sp. FJL06]|uniref:hypothetical protein n=1 Tax=Acidovorax sp. FJL06 TaxID=2153365 RepID=UPI000F55B17E|nr:hypothetical protein [Acidovorax sp. FJL06]RQO83477.1 hypothetical protein DBV10_03910 [Acidovorax sp. FJL06]
MIGQLSLQPNDLDFRYLPAKLQASSPGYAELRAVVDVSRYYAKGGHHIVFALDCEGGQGAYNPHCGPIYRHGDNLFATARGVIVLGDGTVMYERWNGTFAPELVPISNNVPGAFDPAAHRCLTVRVRCHYAGGVSVRIRSGIGGPVVFDGVLSTPAWAWPGHMHACVAAIALGFVAPKDTGCTEQILPRSAPDAELGFAAFSRVV